MKVHGSGCGLILHRPLIPEPLKPSIGAPHGHHLALLRWVHLPSRCPRPWPQPQRWSRESGEVVNAHGREASRPFRLALFPTGAPQSARWLWTHADTLQLSLPQDTQGACYPTGFWCFPTMQIRGRGVKKDRTGEEGGRETRGVSSATPGNSNFCPMVEWIFFLWLHTSVNFNPGVESGNHHHNQDTKQFITTNLPV